MVVLDWYPTVRELGRLRRQRSDLQGKIKNYDVTASGFVFPDKEEEKHLGSSRGYFEREVPGLEDDAAWLIGCRESLSRQAQKDNLAGALLLFPAAPGGELEPAVRLTGQGPAPDWLAIQMPWMQKSLNAASPGRFPWKSLFSGADSTLQPLASRPLVVAIAAPLPALLNFINHCTWNPRLEIVRLRLEPGGRLCPRLAGLPRQLPGPALLSLDCSAGTRRRRRRAAGRSRFAPALAESRPGHRLRAEKGNCRRLPARAASDRHARRGAEGV